MQENGKHGRFTNDSHLRRVFQSDNGAMVKTARLLNGFISQPNVIYSMLLCVEVPCQLIAAYWPCLFSQLNAACLALTLSDFEFIRYTVVQLTCSPIDIVSFRTAHETAVARSRHSSKLSSSRRRHGLQASTTWLSLVSWWCLRNVSSVVAVQIF